MTDTQLYLAIGIPTLAILVGILINGLITQQINARISGVESRIGSLETSLNHRFDDMRDLWRAELHRVEEVLDARLSRIEEHLHFK